MIYGVWLTNGEMNVKPREDLDGIYLQRYSKNQAFLSYRKEDMGGVCGIYNHVEEQRIY